MGELTILTWNCFGAAQNWRSLLSWRGVVDPHRLSHPELISSMKGLDVVCIQELYLDDAGDFFERLEHPHKTRDHNRTTFFPFTIGGSGLGIASRFAMTTQKLIPFARPHLSSERFARKGMLHARIDCGQMGEVDVLTTHMQSGYKPDARKIRERQVRQLRATIDELGSDERAFIVTGDFNICGLERNRLEEYAKLREILDDFADLGAEQDFPTFHPELERNELAHRFEASSAPQRVDYMLMRPARERGPRALSCELALDARLVGHGPDTFASDHFALRAKFHWSL